MGPFLETRARLDPDGTGTDADTRAERPDRRPRQLPRPRAQNRIAFFQAFGDIELGEDPVEVDLDVVHADPLRVPADPPQQTGLAIPTGRGKPDRVPSLGEGKQPVRLFIPINQVVGFDRLGEDEGIEWFHQVQSHSTKKVQLD
ncbi:MAG: hypothetical protein JSS97_05565 [Actinobacteria bacterium]|nr:hypothetical protein [Actinomycetota bacterium]